MNLLLKHIRWYSEGAVHSGDIRLGKGRILETGQGLAPRRRERVLNLAGYLALPGLINAHDHLEMNLFPQLGNPPYENFYEWGRDIYKPEVSPVKDIQRVSLTDRLLWGGYKNLISGVTTVVHHNPYHRVLGRGFPVKVLREYAWSHSLGHSSDVADAHARSKGLPFIIHAAEGIDEASEAEIEQLDQLGVLSANTILVHAVAVTPNLISRLAERKVGVVWCPASNFHLFGQTAPIDRLKDVVQVALGTDSTMSGSPTIWDELRVAATTEMTTPNALLDMVTTIPASMFGLPAGTGTLREQAPADLIVLPDTGANVADAMLAATPASLALVLLDGVPHLADADLAEHLGLKKSFVYVEGVPKWITGAFRPLQRRIEKVVSEEILARNPVWTLFAVDQPVSVL